MVQVTTVNEGRTGVRSRTLLGLVAVLSLALCLSCSGPGGEASSSVDIHSKGNPVIDLGAGSWLLGQTVSWRCRIYANGQGISWSPWSDDSVFPDGIEPEQTKSFRISESDLEALLQRLDELGFLSLPVGSYGMRTFDDGLLHLEASFRGKSTYVSMAGVRDVNTREAHICLMAWEEVARHVELPVDAEWPSLSIRSGGGRR